jgi:RNAse (barnase) inhibitor barstar
MPLYPTHLVKNYFLEKLLDTRLHFTRGKSQITNFVKGIKSVKKVLIILPRDRAEEVQARKYLTALIQVFDKVQVSTLDVFSLRRIDVNWLGIPNDSYLNRIRSEKFDMTIDLNSHHDVLCTYLTGLIEAPVRLHLVEGKFDKIYNLHIRSRMEAPIEKRYQNLVNYLAHLRH